MCGIFGIIALKDMNMRKAVLRQILKNLAKNSQSRGRDATGYAFASKKGVDVFKHNVPAQQFVELDNYKSVVRTELANKDFYSVIGHTRAQTKGSHTNPANNHPIKVGSIVGVHNGVIINDDELFKWLNNTTKGEVERIAQVDSEIIFSLINYYSTKNKFPSSIPGVKLVGNIAEPTSEAIKEAASQIRGSFACAALDAQNPKAVWIFRGSGPVTIKHFVDEGLVVYASEERFISDAVSLFSFNAPKEIKIDTFSGICVNAEENTFNNFALKPVTGRTHSWQNF